MGGEQIGLTSQVGLKKQTWGYHSDDGSIMSGQELDGDYKVGKMLSRPNSVNEFGVGDKVCVSVDMVKRTIRFEKNGKPIGKWH